MIARSRSDCAQTICRSLASPLIGNNLERNLLALDEATYPGAFHCADVHEDVLAAIIRLDKTKAFLTVKPLYGSLRHVTLLSNAGKLRREPRLVGSRFGRINLSPGARATPNHSA